MKRRGPLSAVAASVGAPLVADELIQAGFAALWAKGAEEDWGARVVGYGRDYMALGAGPLQTRLASDLIVMQQHLDSPTGITRGPPVRPEGHGRAAHGPA